MNTQLVIDTLHNMIGSLENHKNEIEDGAKQQAAIVSQIEGAPGLEDVVGQIREHVEDKRKLRLGIMSYIDKEVDILKKIISHLENIHRNIRSRAGRSSSRSRGGGDDHSTRRPRH